ncbi:hypothetical protein D770_09260 [Flammeovirgaceae bacterium 311]|nr:hypothetical protein D770_09260 [Flammeovirgaceae bacterium 311]
MQQISPDVLQGQDKGNANHFKHGAGGKDQLQEVTKGFIPYQSTLYQRLQVELKGALLLCTADKNGIAAIFIDKRLITTPPCQYPTAFKEMYNGCLTTSTTILCRA